MPLPALLKRDDDVEALTNSSNTVPRRQTEIFSQNSEITNWIVRETVVQFSLRRIVDSLVRQLNIRQPLPRFTGSYSPNLHQDSHANGIVQSSSESRTALKPDSSHRRPSPPVPRRQRATDPISARHQQQKEKLMTLLHPIFEESNSDCSHLFLCWGRKDQCKILAIRIPNSADDVAIWQLIRQAWYRHRGSWRKYIRVLDVQQVKVVKVRPGWTFSNSEPVAVY